MMRMMREGVLAMRRRTPRIENSTILLDGLRAKAFATALAHDVVSSVVVLKYVNPYILGHSEMLWGLTASQKRH